MIELKFVEDGIKAQVIEEYLKKLFESAEYSHTDIKMTPVSTRLIIYVGRPGIAIGKAGKNIIILTNELKSRFKVKNPQIDIKGVMDSELDAAVVAKKIASAFERNPKSMRSVAMYLDSIIERGAVGAEISISGKISGARARASKMMKGYIKKCGSIATDYIDHGFATANLKPGVIGIKVSIMKSLPESIYLEKQIKSGKLKIKKDEKKEEQKAAEAKKETAQPATPETEAKRAAPAPEEIKEAAKEEIKAAAEKKETPKQEAAEPKEAKKAKTEKAKAEGKEKAALKAKKKKAESSAEEKKKE